jgi:hypothetical protein
MSLNNNTQELTTPMTKIDRERAIAQLNKALYPADRQAKYLDLQAEVDTLLQQLQALSIKKD